MTLFLYDEFFFLSFSSLLSHLLDRQVLQRSIPPLLALLSIPPPTSGFFLLTEQCTNPIVSWWRLTSSQHALGSLSIAAIRLVVEHLHAWIVHASSDLWRQRHCLCRLWPSYESSRFGKFTFLTRAGIFGLHFNQTLRFLAETKGDIWNVPATPVLAADDVLYASTQYHLHGMFSLVMIFLFFLFFFLFLPLRSSFVLV